MLRTAKQHFDEDMIRAKSLLAHAKTLPTGTLHDDILRAAWMFSVGACDAYFSDAYTDLLSRTLRAKDLEPTIPIPDRLNDLRIPVVAVLRQSTGGWRWRMAARELMEDENVLSLEKIKKLFNMFFRDRQKLISEDTVDGWILHPEAKSRLFGITATAYRKLARGQQGQVKKDALKQFNAHFEQVFQRRHDCIHNCDRPKFALQDIQEITVHKRIQDIEFLVTRCHEAFLSEFPFYLLGLGFSASTRSQVSQ